MPSPGYGSACADETMTDSGFRATLASLWFRLISLGIVGLVFAEALFLAKARIQGWTFYLTISEVAFEIAVRLIFVALAGILLGTIFTALVIPFIKLSRNRAVEWATNVFVVALGIALLRGVLLYNLVIFLGNKPTRAIAGASIAAAVVLVATEFVFA